MLVGVWVFVFMLVYKGATRPLDSLGFNYCLGCNPSPISLIAQRKGKRNAPAHAPQEAL